MDIFPPEIFLPYLALVLAVLRAAGKKGVFESARGFGAFNFHREEHNP
jgi:hypothetical protein